MPATIKSCNLEEEIRFEDGKRMNKWAVTVDDNGQEVSLECWRPPNFDQPEVGDTGDIEGKKFKLHRKSGATGGGGNRGGRGGGGWQPRLEDDPAVYAAKQAAIAAQTSLERAIDYHDRCGHLATSSEGDEVLVGRILTTAGKFEEHVAERARAEYERVRRNS